MFTLSWEPSGSFFVRERKASGCLPTLKQESCTNLVSTLQLEKDQNVGSF